MELTNSKILVIGGAGFIGSFVVSELLKENVQEIIIYDNFARGKIDYLSDSLKDEIIAAENYEIELFDRISKKAIKLDGKIKHSTNYGPIGGENYTRVGFVFSNLPLAKEVTTKIMDSNIERIVNNSMLCGREDETKKAS